MEDKKTEAIKLMQLLESCRLKETLRVLFRYGVIRVSELLELEPQDELRCQRELHLQAGVRADPTRELRRSSVVLFKSPSAYMIRAAASA